MRRHDAGRDGQAEAAAPALPGPAFVEPDKAFEHPLPVRLRNRLAVVVDRDDSPASGRVQADPDPGDGMPVRVVQDIAQHLRQPAGVALDLCTGRELGA